MTKDEIEALHEMNKGKRVNLAYLKPGGKKTGNCYLDCDKNLQFFHPNNSTKVEVQVYKQLNGVGIFVAVEKLWIQSKTKGSVIRVLYGR